MSHIPHALDEMMWLIAEQRDAASIEAFTNRYPDLRGELLRRVNMVYDLRSMKPESQALPPFRPRVESGAGRLPFRPMVFAAIALSALAFGSYFGTKSWLQGQQASAQQTNSSTPVQGRFEPQPDVTVPTNPDPAPEYRPQPQPAESKPDPGSVTLNIKSAPLSLVLQQIAQSTGWQIEIAPGTPDPTISAFYSREPVMEVLRAIGAEAGFTPMEQEPKHVLIIPATEPGRVTPVETPDKHEAGPTPGGEALPKPSDN